VDLPAGAGFVRVIAGSYNGVAGPARTFSPMNVWDVRVKAGRPVAFELPDGHTTAVFVLKGGIQLPGGEVAREGELAVMERAGTQLAFEAVQGADDATLLLLNGAPTNEPIVGYGPFVMNSEAEIRQAFVDFQSGKMGRIAATA
jgi:redox-sensitive bicupin YhaK (pirin superfamily)